MMGFCKCGATWDTEIHGTYCPVCNPPSKVQALEAALAAERDAHSKTLEERRQYKRGFVQAEADLAAERGKRRCHRYDLVANDCWCEREDYIFRQLAAERATSKELDRLLNVMTEQRNAERERAEVLEPYTPLEQMLSEMYGHSDDDEEL